MNLEFKHINFKQNDSDDDEVICSWDCNWEDGEYNGCEFTESLEAGDDYECSLSVHDPYGTVSSDFVNITINSEPNSAPIADAGENIEVAIPHNSNLDTTPVSFNLDGSGQDGEGDNFECNWDCSWENGEYNECVQPIFELIYPSEYFCTLTVTDVYGDYTDATIDHTV